MGRAPSIETQLRTSKRSHQACVSELHYTRQKLHETKQRMEKAEKEAEEWKSRFDALLKRDSKV